MGWEEHVDVPRRLTQHVLEPVAFEVAGQQDPPPSVLNLQDNAVGIVGRQAVAGGGMQHGQLEASIDTFSEVIRRRPDFAEGWNKRATVYYLVGEYRKSAADCDEVLKRNPAHFGALSGYGMIWLRLDEPARALERFEQALAVNPNLDSVRETIEGLRALLIQQRRNAI